MFNVVYWQYAEFPSSASDAVLCTVLVCKIWVSNEKQPNYNLRVRVRVSRRTLQCRVRHLTPTYVMTNELQLIVKLCDK